MAPSARPASCGPSSFGPPPASVPWPPPVPRCAPPPPTPPPMTPCWPPCPPSRRCSPASTPPYTPPPPPACPRPAAAALRPRALLRARTRGPPPRHPAPHPDASPRPGAQAGPSPFHAYPPAYVSRHGQRFPVALTRVTKGQPLHEVV